MGSYSSLAPYQKLKTQIIWSDFQINLGKNLFMLLSDCLHSAFC